LLSWTINYVRENSFLHRFEQYFTSSHTAFHFLRQVKGLWQLQQILLGKSDFFIFDQINY